MRLFLSFSILIYVLPLTAQNSCGSAKKINIDSLNTITNFTSNTVYFKIRKDSLGKSVSFSGAFDKLTVQPKECGAEKSYVLDSSGMIVPTEEMINSGICYCNSCIQRYSKFKLSNDLFLKIEGPEELLISVGHNKKEKELAWFEKKLKSGDKIQLKNILFVGGEAKFRSVSFKDLNRLYDVLKRNSLVSVEIQGHVNSPGKRNNKENQNLSDARAKAVVDYLIKKGIKPNRLTAVGYGNTQMIYPKAKTEFEMQFNRRVEVLVK